MKKYYVQLSLLSLALGMSTSIFAGGFQVWEQTAYGTGDYHAGAAAEGDNASLEFYNPAQITNLKHQEISSGAVYIPADVKFDGTVNGLSAGRPVSSITNNVIPNFHYVLPLTKQWYFAFGVTSPFGLETRYPSNYPATVSFAATETRLLTVNLNPNIAYAFNNHVSLAAGFDALYGEAVYNNNVFGTGIFKNHLDAWAYGYNVGLYVSPMPRLRFGASYRSSIDLHARGKSTMNDTKTTVRAKFPLPSTTIFSGYYQVIPKKWSVMASAFYTRWSIFTDLLLKNTATFNEIPVAEDYRNSWNFAVGTKFAVARTVYLELGTGYDQTPTRKGYRDIRLPDDNHWVLSTGLEWKPVKAFDLDLGYTHLFMPTTTVDNSQSSAQSKNEVPTQLGTAKSSINVIGAQVTWSIGA